MLVIRPAPSPLPQTMIVSFAFGTAGDAYMNMVKFWHNRVVSYQEQFNTMSANPVNDYISEIVETFVHEKYREWFLKFPKDIEESMSLAKTCFDVALKLCWHRPGGGDPNNGRYVHQT